MVCASSRRSQSIPRAVSPVSCMLRTRTMPQIARMVPLAMGSRISTLPRQAGSRISSQSAGASLSGTAELLYAMIAGVR